MLDKLRHSGFGCYVDNDVCGSLALADDVVILAPTKSALNQILAVAYKCATQLKLRFNGNKSKYIVYRAKNSSCPMNISEMFYEVSIIESTQGIHLGNFLGISSCRDSVINSIRDLNSRTNQLLSRFSFCSPEVRYKLFRSRCVIAFGSPLWDYDDPVIAEYTTQHGASVCVGFGESPTVHIVTCCRESAMTGTSSPSYYHVVRFFQTAVLSSNLLLFTIARLALIGSCSPLSSTISFIAEKHNVNRQRITCTRVTPPVSVGPMHGAIRDFAFARHMARGDERDHYTQILVDMCVN